jgi:hypothetical protein
LFAVLRKVESALQLAAFAENLETNRDSAHHRRRISNTRNACIFVHIGERHRKCEFPSAASIATAASCGV